MKAWSKRVGAKLPELEDNLNASQANVSEFMSDSFIQKNIRVRPTSAVAMADETSSRVSHGQSPHRGEDEH